MNHEMFRSLLPLAACTLLAAHLAAQRGGGSTPPANPAITYANGSYVAVMNADGTNVRNVVNAGSSYCSPTWSPDGSQIAFIGTPTGGSGRGLYVVGVNGTGLRRVLPMGQELGRPSWSPVPTVDGHSKLALLKDDPITGYMEVVVVNLDGTGLTYLTGDLVWSPDSPSWSPDATRIACASLGGTECRVLTLGLDGSGQITVSAWMELTSQPGSPLAAMALNGWECWRVEWSNTSDRVLLDMVDPWGSGAMDFWIVPVNDPAAAYSITGGLATNVREGSWSPEDSQIVFQQPGSRRSTQLAKMSANGIVLGTLGVGARPDWRRTP